MVVMLMSFSCMMSMFLVPWEIKDKIVLHCFSVVKCQQSYTSGI